MTAFERLKKLCHEQGISINVLEERIGLGKNTLYAWKKKIPGGVNLQKVADYFHVSTDYLLGRTDNPNLPDNTIVTDEDLDKVLDGVMSFGGKPLTDEDREAVRAFMQGRKSK
jgi:Predicted transcriptional regulators